MTAIREAPDPAMPYMVQFLVLLLLTVLVSCALL